MRALFAGVRGRWHSPDVSAVLARYEVGKTAYSNALTGRYGAGYGLSQCSPCLSSTFGDVIGASNPLSCKNCPLQSTSAAQQGLSCVCQDGYISLRQFNTSNVSAFSCLLCPSESTCSAG